MPKKKRKAPERELEFHGNFRSPRAKSCINEIIKVLQKHAVEDDWMLEWEDV